MWPQELLFQLGHRPDGGWNDQCFGISTSLWQETNENVHHCLQWIYGLLCSKLMLESHENMALSAAILTRSVTSWRLSGVCSSLAHYITSQPFFCLLPIGKEQANTAEPQAAQICREKVPLLRKPCSTLPFVTHTHKKTPENRQKLTDTKNPWWQQCTHFQSNLCLCWGCYDAGLWEWFNCVTDWFVVGPVILVSYPL